MKVYAHHVKEILTIQDLRSLAPIAKELHLLMMKRLCVVSVIFV